MGHNVSVAKLEPIIGKSTFYNVKNGEVHAIEENLPSNVIFILNLVRVSSDDKDIVLGQEQDGKRFVPSFELAKSEKEFIINYFAEATEEQPAIKLRGVIDIETNTISLTGEGFESGEVEIVEYLEVDAPASAE